MELGFFVVPGFEKKVALGPEIPAHGGKKLVIKNSHLAICSEFEFLIFEYE